LDAWRQRRTDFCRQLDRVIADDELLIAIDESGFDQRPKNALYGYAPRGQQAIVIGPTCSSNRHLTLLMAICPKAGSPVESHQLLEHSVNGDRFAAFVLSLPYVAPVTILLDNASIHRTRVVKDAVAARGYNLLFVPPYSPECNPIENIFGIIKQKFYRCRVQHPTTRGLDIRNQINQIVDEKVNVANVAGAFGHMVRIVRADDFVRGN
jgi:transposase